MKEYRANPAVQEERSEAEILIVVRPVICPDANTHRSNLQRVRSDCLFASGVILFVAE
jgi:hypothetical protein